mgnify:CR=1 FL=1
MYAWERHTAYECYEALYEIWFACVLCAGFQVIGIPANNKCVRFGTTAFQADCSFIFATMYALLQPGE